MPELEKVRQLYESRGVGFLALSLEPDRAAVRRAALQLGIQMRVATAASESLGPLGVNSVPSTVFLDRDATIVAAVTGVRSQGFFERRVRALVSRNGY